MAHARNCRASAKKIALSAIWHGVDSMRSLRRRQCCLTKEPCIEAVGTTIAPLEIACRVGVLGV